MPLNTPSTKEPLWILLSFTILVRERESFYRLYACIAQIKKKAKTFQFQIARIDNISHASCLSSSYLLILRIPQTSQNPPSTRPSPFPPPSRREKKDGCLSNKPLDIPMGAPRILVLNHELDFAETAWPKIGHVEGDSEEARSIFAVEVVVVFPCWSRS